MGIFKGNFSFIPTNLALKGKRKQTKGPKKLGNVRPHKFIGHKNTNKITVKQTHLL